MLSMRVKFFARLVTIVCIILSSLSFGGDVGLGGGQGRIVYSKVKQSKKTPVYYFFLDEVSRIGDFGTGGGLQSRWKKMQSRLEEVLRGTNKNSRFQRARAHNGERFVVTRALIPGSEFGRFEVGEVVAFIMKDEQKIGPQEIESIQVKRKRADDVYLIRDLVSIKIDTGETFDQRDIAAIEIEFQIEDEETSSSATK